MSNHNKRTHDSLLDRLYQAIRERYGAKVEKEVSYPRGEIDVLRYDSDGNPDVAYEVKSNNLFSNYKKAEKQLNRYENFISEEIRTVYVSQHSLGGDFFVERTYNT